jgi:hypothetical protein
MGFASLVRFLDWDRIGRTYSIVKSDEVKLSPPDGTFPAKKECPKGAAPGVIRVKKSLTFRIRNRYFPLEEG